MTDRQTIIKQRVIIALLVIVIIAGLMATAKMTENYAETNEGFIEVSNALRDRVVELTSENEWLKNRNEVLEESE